MARAAAVADDRRLLDDVGFFARRRIAKARAWADSRVPALGGDLVGIKVHRLRVTWLRMAQELAPNAPAVGDAAAADRAFHDALAALGPTPLPTSWRLRTKLLMAGGVAAAAVGTWGVLRVVNAPPPPIGDGALLAPEDEQTLAGAVTEWVIGIDQWTRVRSSGAVPREVQDARDTVDARRGAIVTPALATFFGGEATEALGEVLDQVERTALGRHWESDEAGLAEDVRVLNRSLAEAGRAYFFDSYAALYPDGRPETALFLFRVAARREWRVQGGGADAEVIPALHLRRLDRLNIVQLLLGYTSKRMDVAALLLDQLEKEMVTRVGPALAPDRDMPLERMDEDAAADWVPLVRAAAGARIRQAFEAEFAGDLGGMRELGVLLARRAGMVEDWQKALDAQGLRLTAFDHYAFDDGDLDSIESHLGRRARAMAEELQAALDAEPVKRRFAAALARHARPVEQHEVQHRLDYRLGDAFVAPDAVLELLDIPRSSELARHDDVLRMTYELSAYTSEIARDPAWAAIDLTLLAEHLFEGTGGAEGHSAILVLDGLREVLGLPGLRLADTPPVSAASAATAYLALMKVPSDNLARAAGELWTRWFKRELPVLAPVSPDEETRL
ncbi:MAG: hypothetical protein U1F43_23430 [Myxococcota bacterium]